MLTVAIAGDLDMAGTLKLEPQVDALVNDSRIELLVLDLGASTSSTPLVWACW